MERKEAIEIVRKLYNESLFLKKDKEAMVTLIPELAESEDKRIRAMAIKAVYAPEAQSCIKSWGINPDDVIAWLEKQGKMNMESYKVAEDEKREFVGGGFIKCYANFQDFKEGNTYWLEYVGNDNYNVRSDNLLGKTYHITPCQLYTIFKKQTWLEKQGEQESAWSEEDEKYLKLAIENFQTLGNSSLTAWLKSLKERVQPKQEWSEDTQQWIDTIIKDYEDLYDADKNHRAIIQAKINILKSLRPQSTWKPSIAQLNAISIVSKGNAPDDIEEIKSLYEDLKKL